MGEVGDKVESDETEIERRSHKKAPWVTIGCCAMSQACQYRNV